MFPNIQVLSRENMIVHSFEIVRPSIIVSISDRNAASPTFSENPNIIDVLYLFFDDEESGSTRMSSEDADSIVEFLRAYDDSNVDLYFHCNGGVSRSAACAAAAMLIEWGDDSDIFNDGRYCPNMHCYRSVLDAADITYDHMELARKEKEQFDLWCAEHREDLNI